MYPELLAEYDILVSEYREQGWGIYDETTELHRAITLTDAYYGDMSSLVMLYYMTGKPIMISNPTVLDDELPFEPTSIYVTEEKIWFSICRLNALICMDRETWIPEFIGSFPGENDYFEEPNHSLYRNPVAIDSVFYFPPFLAKEIAEYTPLTGGFKKLKCNSIDDTGHKNMNFFGSVAYKESVFFTPQSFPAIIELNTITNEVSHHTDWLFSLNKLQGDNSGNYINVFFGLPLIVGTSIWLTYFRSNAILEFNMETHKSTVYEIGMKEYRYSRIHFDGAFYWLTPRGFTRTPVIKWNPKLGVIREFHDIYTGTDNNSAIVLFPLFADGYLLLLPTLGEIAVKINMCTDVVSTASEFESGFPAREYNQSSINCVYAQAYGDIIYAYFAHTGTLIEYNCKSGERREEFIQYPVETSEQLCCLAVHSLKCAIKEIETVNDCHYDESTYIQLTDFISYISDADDDIKSAMTNRRKEIADTLVNNSNGTAGQAIYAYVKAFAVD